MAQLTIGKPLTSHTSGYTSAPTESIWKSIIQGAGSVGGGLMSGWGGKAGGGGKTGGAPSSGGSYYYG